MGPADGGHGHQGREEGRAEARRLHRGRRQAIRAHREDPRRRAGGLLRAGRSDVQQGRDALEDEAPHREPAHPAAGLPAGVQEGREPDQRGDHERGELQLAAAPGGGVHRADLRQREWSSFYGC